jgi:hypothetical protein
MDREGERESTDCLRGALGRSALSKPAQKPEDVLRQTRRNESDRRQQDLHLQRLLEVRSLWSKHGDHRKTRKRTDVWLPYHRYRGVCENDLRITKKRLEQQLLGRIATSLRAPEYVEVIAEGFERQLKAAHELAQGAAQELTGKVDELRRERTALVKRAANLADAIGLHGPSNALSAQLSEAERRIEVIDRLLKPQPKSDPVAFAPEVIREFLTRKMAQLVDVLASEPQLAKQEIASRIDKLVLTPEVRDGRRVFAVTGDINLFSGNDDPIRSQSDTFITQRLCFSLRPNSL